VNLEAIAMQRAEEQMESDRWRRPDRGEAAVVIHHLTCEVCGQDYKRDNRGAKSKADICQPCGKKGWRSRRCTTCEGSLNTRDYPHGVCRKCRVTARAA
jgi:hypothetical protein